MIDLPQRKKVNRKIPALLHIILVALLLLVGANSLAMAAEDQNVESKMLTHLAHILVEKNSALAELEADANNGDIDAQTQLADYYYEKQDFDNARLGYEKAAKLGSDSALLQLGFMYDEGLGVDQDYIKAVEFYQQAALLGNASGQFNLAYMYDEGLGVERDYAIARNWYEKSAAQQHPFAENNLGYMYEKGLGVKQDYQKARYWYQKSAIQGDDLAQFHVGTLYEYGLGVKKNLTQAKIWYTKSAEQGNEQAECSLCLLDEARCEAELRLYCEQLNDE